MKKVISAAFLILFFCFPVFSQTIARQRVVVLPGTGQYPVQLTRAVNLTVELMERLGRFEVIDRRTTDQAMEELKLQLTGFLDENAVISIGNMMSSDIGMVIDLTNYRSEKNTDYSASLSAGEISVETRYDAVVEIAVRQFNINTTQSLRTISVKAEAEGRSSIEAEENAFASVRSQLFERLKEFYPLVFTVREKQAGYVVISGGENLGVYKGMRFDVFPTMSSISRSGLIIVERADQDTSVAKILKGFSGIESSHVVKERIGTLHEIAISAGVSVNSVYRDIKLAEIAVEFDTYNTLSGGMNFMFSITETPVDFVRGSFFLTYKPVLADQFDFGLRGGLGVSHFFNAKDENNKSVMMQYFQLFGGAISTIYLNNNLGFFASWDYYLYPFKINDWFYVRGTGDDAEKVNAKGTIEEVDLKGSYFTAGIKFIF